LLSSLNFLRACDHCHQAKDDKHEGPEKSHNDHGDEQQEKRSGIHFSSPYLIDRALLPNKWVEGEIFGRTASMEGKAS